MSNEVEAAKKKYEKEENDAGAVVVRRWIPKQIGLLLTTTTTANLEHIVGLVGLFLNFIPATCLYHIFAAREIKITLV